MRLDPATTSPGRGASEGQSFGRGVAPTMVRRSQAALGHQRYSNGETPMSGAWSLTPAWSLTTAWSVAVTAPLVEAGTRYGHPPASIGRGIATRRSRLSCSAASKRSPRCSGRASPYADTSGDPGSGSAANSHSSEGRGPVAPVRGRCRWLSRWVPRASVPWAVGGCPGGAAGGVSGRVPRPSPLAWSRSRRGRRWVSGWGRRWCVREGPPPLALGLVAIAAGPSVGVRVGPPVIVGGASGEIAPAPSPGVPSLTCRRRSGQRVCC